MKLIGKIPENVRAIIRSHLSGKRIIIPEELLIQWLGFEKLELRKELSKLNISSLSYSNPSFDKFSGGGSVLSKSDIDYLLLYPTCLICEETPADLTEDKIKSQFYSIEDYREYIFSEAGRISAIFDHFKPHAVVVVQGYETSSAIARLIGFKRNIPVISFENTALINRILWDDHSAITTNMNLAKNFFWKHQNPYSESGANGYCEQIISTTKACKSGEHASPNRKFNGFDNESPTIIFLGQVYTDSSILYGIGRWRNPVELLSELAQLSVRLKFNLIIKLHPKEFTGSAPMIDLPYSSLTYRKLMDNRDFTAITSSHPGLLLDYDNRYDTYSLISQSKVAVTVNSQAGLEAAIRGVPTITCGNAFYGDLGFTWSATEKHMLEPQIKHLLAIGFDHKDHACKLAREFTHIYFERYCINKSPIDMAALIDRRIFSSSI